MTRPLATAGKIVGYSARKDPRLAARPAHVLLAARAQHPWDSVSYHRFEALENFPGLVAPAVVC